MATPWQQRAFGSANLPADTAKLSEQSKPDVAPLPPVSSIDGRTKLGKRRKQLATAIARDYLCGPPTLYESALIENIVGMLLPLEEVLAQPLASDDDVVRTANATSRLLGALRRSKREPPAGEELKRYIASRSKAAA